MAPVGSALLVGHVASAVHADNTARLLLVDQEEHPASVGFPQHQIDIVVGLPDRVPIREALLRFQCRDVVAVEELLLSAAVPLELKLRSMAPPSSRHSTRLEAMGRSKPWMDTAYLALLHGPIIAERYTRLQPPGRLFIWAQVSIAISLSRRRCVGVAPKRVPRAPIGLGGQLPFPSDPLYDCPGGRRGGRKSVSEGTATVEVSSTIGGRSGEVRQQGREPEQLEPDEDGVPEE